MKKQQPDQKNISNRQSIQSSDHYYKRMGNGGIDL